MTSKTMALRACPMWQRSYTVTPQTYIRTSPGTSGLNSSSRRVSVLWTRRLTRPPRRRRPWRRYLPSARPSPIPPGSSPSPSPHPGSPRPGRGAGPAAGDEGRSRDRLASRADASPSAPQVDWRRDLYVLGEPGHDAHLLAEPLDQHRVVGAGDAIATGLVMCLAQEIDPEGLRRLDGDQLRSVERAGDRSVAHALDGLGDGHRADGGTRRAGGDENGIDQGRRDEWSHRVVDDDQR